MQRITQSHNIQSVNLLDSLKFRNLPAPVLEKEISFSYKDRQNKFRRSGLLDLLILNLKIPHKIFTSYIVVLIFNIKQMIFLKIRNSGNCRQNFHLHQRNINLSIFMFLL